MEFKLPTRVPTSPWNHVLTRFRDAAEMSRFALCRATKHRVQHTALALYESGERKPSIERFIEMVEATGGVVIVRRGVTEYHLTYSPDSTP